MFRTALGTHAVSAPSGIHLDKLTIIFTLVQVLIKQSHNSR
jgi:hypothetical protein